MRNSPVLLAASILLVAWLSPAAGQEQPSRPGASNYHFIVDFSRHQLVVTEMIARPEGHEATAEPGEAISERLRIQLPAEAVLFEVGAGVRPVGDQVVLDFVEAAGGPYLTWKYVLPMRPGTMSIERALPLPVTVATVIVQEVGLALDVTWPEGAAVAPSIADTGRYLIAGARDVPAGAPLTVVISGIPRPPERTGNGWLVWVVGAMVVVSALALVVGPRRR